MSRFLLPLAGMAMALMLLVAGAFGDASSLGQDVRGAIPGVGELFARASTPFVKMSAPVAQASTPSPDAPAYARSPDAPAATRTAADLAKDDGEATAVQTRITQETSALAALNQTADKLRDELATLRAQRQQEQAALDQIKQDRAAQQASAARPQPHPVESPVVDSAVQTPAIPRKPSVAVRHLMDARVALVAGRGGKARQLLGLAHTQLSLRSAAAAKAGDPPATKVGYALTLLDRGDSGGALRAIDQALSDSGEHDDRNP